MFRKVDDYVIGRHLSIIVINQRQVADPAQVLATGGVVTPLGEAGDARISDEDVFPRFSPFDSFAEEKTLQSDRCIQVVGYHIIAGGLSVDGQTGLPALIGTIEIGLGIIIFVQVGNRCL